MRMKDKTCVDRMNEARRIDDTIKAIQDGTMLSQQKKYTVHQLCCECGGFLGVTMSSEDKPVFSGLCTHCYS